MRNKADCHNNSFVKPQNTIIGVPLSRAANCGTCDIGGPEAPWNRN
jgi:hypothetical protein